MSNRYEYTTGLRGFGWLAPIMIRDLATSCPTRAGDSGRRRSRTESVETVTLFKPRCLGQRRPKSLREVTHCATYCDFSETDLRVPFLL